MQVNKLKVLLGSIFTFGLMFFSVANVEARCSDQRLWELQQAAREVRSTIEIIEGTQMREVGDDYTGEFVMVEFTFYEFRINTFNITEDLFVRMTNNVTRQTTTIHDGLLEDGIFTYMTDNTEDIVNYSFGVYTNDEGCFGRSFRSYTVRKPMMNPFSEWPICHGLDEIPYCRRFIDAPLNISEEELPGRIERFLRGPDLDDDDDNAVIEWIRNNTTVIVIVIVVIGGIAGTVFLVIRRRRSIL